MQYKVSVGSRYTVTAAAEDCVVTDAAGRVVATVKPGKQYTFTASTTTVELSDASAALTANFNSAPAGSAAAGGVSEEDLVTLGVLTAGEVPTEKASSPVCVPSGDALIRAKGFRWGGQVQPPAGCNGVAIVVGDDVNDDFLLGCQMRLICTSRASVTLISEPLVSVQEVAAGRRCLFYFTEPISSTELYTIRILKNGVNELVPFSSSMSQAMYNYFSWVDAVDTGYGFYPALAWEVLKKEPVYSPAVDEEPTEGSARPVSSGGVFSALAQLAGGSGSSPDDCEWALCYLRPIESGVGQPDFSGNEATLKEISDSATLYGGAVLPLGSTCVLLRAPYAGAWTDNDFGLFVVNDLKQWDSLEQEACFVYFNI